MNHDPAASVHRGDSHKWKAFSAMAVGLFFGVMDFGGVGIAVPTIAGEFDLELSTASWIVLSAALTISAVLLPVGGLSDIAGRKRSYLAGMAMFGVGALAAGLAPGLVPLLVARVVEAAGSALVMANGMAIVAIVFPASERGKGMGLLTACVGLAAIAGPVVGGGMVDAFGWRSFFYLIAGGAVGAWLLAARTLDERRISSTRRGRSLLRYDWPGAFLSASGLMMLIFVVTGGARLGWGSAWTITGAAAALLLLAAFLAREIRAREPMFDLGAFRNLRFRWAISARFLGFFGSSGWYFLMPFYLQDVLGYPASRVGLISFPGMLGFALLGAFSGRYSDRFGVKPFTVAGLSLVIAGGLMLASLDEHSSVPFIMAALMVNGTGMGLWVAPNMSAAISAVDRSTYGVVSAFMNLVRNTANVIAIAAAAATVAGVLAARGLDSDLSLIAESGSAGIGRAFVDGARYAYLGLAGVAALGLLAAIRTRDRDRTIAAVEAADEGADKVGEPMPG